MKLIGLSKLARVREADPEPVSDQDLGIPGLTPTGPEAGDKADDNADDLELEKRWLQLTRVDADQFRAFDDKYHDPLFQFLALPTGNEETAQDLTQEVFVYAVAHRDRFTWQGYSFGAWLFHIARKRVLARVRSLIERFDDARHDVFVLHVFMEMSARGTALAMGLPWATVRSHLRRGRTQWPNGCATTRR